MASISDDPGGRRRILFAAAPDESRKTIRLGKINRKSAESICRHVEALLAAKIGGQPVPRDTAAWLANIGVKLRDKLATVGLVDAPKRAALGEFLQVYILSRPDVKPATLEVWRQPCRNLTEFFGDFRQPAADHYDGRLRPVQGLAADARPGNGNHRLLRPNVSSRCPQASAD